MGQTPRSSAKRTEPIFELLPTRELGSSLSSIMSTAYNSLEELKKSKASKTYRLQHPGYNPKLLNIQNKRKQPISKKKDNQQRLPNNFKAATTTLKVIS